MLMLALALAFLSLLLGNGFYRKYRSRLHSQSQTAMRYNRLADYYGRPILLAFEYRIKTTQALSLIEADVDEIYHYGNDYFLKGHSADGKRCQIFKWSRIANPRVRFTGRNLESLEQLFAANEGAGPHVVGTRAAACFGHAKSNQTGIKIDNRRPTLTCNPPDPHG